jgi:hypothetical protein
MNKTLSRREAVLISLIICWGLSSFPAFAQKTDLGLDFVIGLPQNEFRDNIDDEGYGISGHVGYFLGNTPIMIGTDIGYLNYGTEERHEPFSDTIPDVIVEVRTTNNIFMLHGFARLQPQRGSVRPYFEGLWGFKYLFTRTSINDDDSYYEETIASSTNIDDFAGSWGLGAGVDIRIWKGRQKTPNRGVFDISLNLSAKYLWGSEAEYLKKGSIRRDPDGGVTYFVMRSNTDMLMPHIGIRIRF